jgi:uncharacterized YccA/Bax inhibitor family protein
MSATTTIPVPVHQLLQKERHKSYYRITTARHPNTFADDVSRFGPTLQYIIVTLFSTINYILKRNFQIIVHLIGFYAMPFNEVSNI